LVVVAAARLGLKVIMEETHRSDLSHQLAAVAVGILTEALQWAVIPAALAAAARERAVIHLVALVQQVAMLAVVVDKQPPVNILTGPQVEAEALEV
jgi:hypothetical protein